MLMSVFIIGLIMFFGGLIAMIWGIIYQEFGFADFMGMIFIACGIVAIMFSGIPLLMGFR